ncbi:MAG: hypothetical protein NTX25_06450 [Proteobacteria bacterium]|nr:hypothetical protein [Pseudomonadota bacterium]
MSDQDVCFDRSFLKLFQSEKNAIMLQLRKGTFLLGEAAKEILSAKDMVTLQEFSELYLSSKSSRDQDSSAVQTEVDAIFEQAQGLLAEGQPSRDISKLLKLDQASEVKRLELAKLQKSLETIIARDKIAEQVLCPIIENLKFSLEIEATMRMASLGFMLLIHSLGPKFELQLDKITVQIQQTISSQDVLSHFTERVFKNGKIQSAVGFLDGLTQFIHANFIICSESVNQEMQRLVDNLLLMLIDAERRRAGVVADSDVFKKDGSRIIENMQAWEHDINQVLKDIRQRSEQIPELKGIFLPLLDSLELLNRVRQQFRNLAVQISFWKIVHGSTTELIVCSRKDFDDFTRSLNLNKPQAKKSSLKAAI